MASKANQEAREARENSIIDEADYFTVVRYLGPGKGYERHEKDDREQAIILATQLAKENNRPYLIYAVKGVHDTFVEGVVPPKRGFNDQKEVRRNKRRVRL